MKNKIPYGNTSHHQTPLKPTKSQAESESFGSIYPVSLDFDAIGNLYFVGIRSPTLWFGNTTEMSGIPPGYY